MLLDGKRIRDELLEELKLTIEEKKLHIKLAIIFVGDSEASQVYVRNKKKYCAQVGIEVIEYKLPENTLEEHIIDLIDTLNKDESITGILLQSPTPKGINFDKCCSHILSTKDVDGFTEENIYKLYMKKETILPCTVKGIIYLLKKYNISLEGKNITIIGRGNIVGKPLALALLNENATVTLAHSYTKNLKEITKEADIVISATGIPNLVTEDMIKEGAIVVDAGVAKKDGILLGDVVFETVNKKASYITPNPGGVGPMTIAMLIDNLVEMELKNDKNL